jgi:hypothetical protein
MTLGEILEYQRVGALKASVQENTIRIGGTEVSKETLAMILNKLGWIQIDQDPIEVIKRMDNIFKAMNKARVITEENDQFSRANVTMQNMKSIQYGSYYNRIKIECGFDRIVIIDSMPKSGAKILIYHNNPQITYKKCSSLKAMAEAIKSIVK